MRVGHACEYGGVRECVLSISTCVSPSREHVSKPEPEPVCVCVCVSARNLTRS